MSLNFDPNEKIWVEKYRPTVVDDCILKENTKERFKQIVESGSVPNMILYGPAGTGKTTLAKALCKELNVDWIIINASNERGLDVIRDKIASFASTTSFNDNGKCVILDEADHLMPATQAAFRHAIEEYSQNCSFVFTCNYPNKIIPALHSRLASVDFNTDRNEMDRMQAEFFFRVCEVLNNEKVAYDESVVATVVQKFFPDNRRVLNQLQQYGRSGTIDEGVLMELDEVSIDSLIQSMKQQKFKAIRQWCADNSDSELSELYTKLYKSLKDFVKGESIPDVILVLEDYQRYDAVVPDRELHLCAMCLEIMSNAEFR